MLLGVSDLSEYNGRKFTAEEIIAEREKNLEQVKEPIKKKYGVQVN